MLGNLQRKLSALVLHFGQYSSRLSFTKAPNGIPPRSQSLSISPVIQALGQARHQRLSSDNNNDDILLTFFDHSRRSQESRENVIILSTYYIERSTRGVVTGSLPEAMLFSGVLPSHSLAVDNIILCDLYMPYKFLSA